MPTEVVQKLNAEITRITRTPEIQKQLAEIGSEPLTATVDGMTSMVRLEKQLWGDLVKAKNITVD
ncbi:Tripartite tricarboxylate transporter family receptor [compost metagenome]